MSIKYKIAFLFSLLLTIILGMLIVAVYFFSAKEREISFNKRLKNRAISTAKVYSVINDTNFLVLQKMDSAAVASLSSKSITIAPNNNSREYMYSDNKGDSLFLTNEIIEQAKSNNEYFFSYDQKKAVAVHYSNGSNDFIIGVAAVDLDGREYLQQLKKILLIAMVLAVTLSFYGGILFAKRLVKPISRIIGEVNLISSNNLSQRIQINDAKDELTKLAATFNHLLDRLQESFSIQRRFISNASHEFSTPLTAISSQLEVAIQKKRTPEEYDGVMKSIYEDIKSLQLLTRTLLDIAKTGSQGSIDLAEVRLDEVLFKVVSEIKKQKPGYTIEINFDVLPEDEKLITVFGNSNLLYIALKNVIENGCKYSDDNQSSISVILDKTNIVIKVSNKGDVIAEADIQNIFQPFFRANSSVQKPGFGLGLTLTKRILFLHKGTISVESSIDKGTIFTVQVPNLMSKP